MCQTSQFNGRTMINRSQYLKTAATLLCRTRHREYCPQHKSSSAAKSAGAFLAPPEIRASMPPGRCHRCSLPRRKPPHHPENLHRQYNDNNNNSSSNHHNNNNNVRRDRSGYPFPVPQVASSLLPEREEDANETEDQRGQPISPAPSLLACPARWKGVSLEISKHSNNQNKHMVQSAAALCLGRTPCQGRGIMQRFHVSGGKQQANNSMQHGLLYLYTSTCRDERMGKRSIKQN